MENEITYGFQTVITECGSAKDTANFESNNLYATFFRLENV